MRWIYKIRCKNKQCGYCVELREGVGMFLFARNRNLEEQVKESRNASSEILRLVDSGKHIESVTSYECPTCKEWLSIDEPFVFEELHISPYGTIREYQLHYLYDKPKCKKCNSELIHIQNVLSGKNTCPKCGLKSMEGRRLGLYD